MISMYVILSLFPRIYINKHRDDVWIISRCAIYVCDVISCHCDCANYLAFAAIMFRVSETTSSALCLQRKKKHCVCIYEYHHNDDDDEETITIMFVHMHYELCWMTRSICLIDICLKTQAAVVWASNDIIDEACEALNTYVRQKYCFYFVSIYACFLYENVTSLHCKDDVLVR